MSKYVPPHLKRGLNEGETGAASEEASANDGEFITDFNEYLKQIRPKNSKHPKEQELKAHKNKCSCLHLKNQADEADGFVITNKKYSHTSPVFQFIGDEAALCSVVENKQRDMEMAKIKLSCGKCMLADDKKNGGLIVLGDEEEIQALCNKAYENKFKLPKAKQHPDIGHEFFCIKLKDLLNQADDKSYNLINVLKNQKNNIEDKKVVLQHHISVGLKDRTFFDENEEYKNQFVFTYAYDDKGDARYPKGWALDVTGGKRRLNESSLACAFRETKNEAVLSFTTEDVTKKDRGNLMKVQVLNAQGDDQMDMFVVKLLSHVQLDTAVPTATAQVLASPPKAKAKTSTTNWADSDSESEEEEQPTEAVAANEEVDEESDSDASDSEDETEEEEEEEEAPETTDSTSVATKEESKPQPPKNLSKKEKKALKEKELEDLDALLNEMGLEPQVTESAPETTSTPAAAEEPATGSSDSKKKKKNKKKPNNKESAASEPTAAAAETVAEGETLSAAEVLKAKAKGKKKVAAGSDAAKLATLEAKKRAEADAKKKKKKKDKSGFNQAPR